MAEYEYDPKAREWVEKPPRRALTPIERWFADWGARNYILYFLWRCSACSSSSSVG